MGQAVCRISWLNESEIDRLKRGVEDHDDAGLTRRLGRSGHERRYSAGMSGRAACVWFHHRYL